MFIIIWGSRNKIHEEGIINYVCLVCTEPQVTVCSYRSWFTLFFIPVFPTESKKYFLSCANCENSYKIKDDVNIEELLNESNKKEDGDNF